MSDLYGKINLLQRSLFTYSETALTQGSPTFFTPPIGWGSWGTPTLVRICEQAHALSRTNEHGLVCMHKQQCCASAGTHTLVHMCKQQHSDCAGTLACAHAQMAAQHLSGCACTHAHAQMVVWRAHRHARAHTYVRISCARVSACGERGRRSVSVARSGSGHRLATGCGPEVGDLWPNWA